VTVRERLAQSRSLAIHSGRRARHQRGGLRPYQRWCRRRRRSARARPVSRSRRVSDHSQRWCPGEPACLPGVGRVAHRWNVARARGARPRRPCRDLAEAAAPARRWDALRGSGEGVRVVRRAANGMCGANVGGVEGGVRTDGGERGGAVWTARTATAHAVWTARTAVARGVCGRRWPVSAADRGRPPLAAHTVDTPHTGWACVRRSRGVCGVPVVCAVPGAGGAAGGGGTDGAAGGGGADGEAGGGRATARRQGGRGGRRPGGRR
jgi:hypothetical protein